jgi:hypothetical protein
MSEGLNTGAWKGRRAFILGGGPSLNEVDLSLLRDELTLGLNVAYLHDPTAALIYDKRLIDALESDMRWAAYKGEKFWLNYEAPAIPRDILVSGARQLRPLTSAPPAPRWPTTLEQGIFRGNNCGTAAICLADILQADPIYLLGFDFRVGAGKPVNWHELYPDKWRATEKTLMEFRTNLGSIKGLVRSRVINLTPDSRLDAFPKEDYYAVLRQQALQP